MAKVLSRNSTCTGISLRRMSVFASVRRPVRSVRHSAAISSIGSEMTFRNMRYTPTMPDRGPDREMRESRGRRFSAGKIPCWKSRQNKDLLRINLYI